MRSLDFFPLSTSIRDLKVAKIKCFIAPFTSRGDWVTSGHTAISLGINDAGIAANAFTDIGLQCGTFLGKLGVCEE
jgi:hypothetical protein